MSYADKIELAHQAIITYNKMSEKNIDGNKFVNDLKNDGYIDEGSLSHDITWETLENLGLPSGLAKKVARFFRQKNDENNYEKTVAISKKIVQTMTVSQLLDHYDPKEAEDNSVSSRIKKISKGLRCIVFNSDGIVNVRLSERIINEIREGYGDRDVIHDPDSDEMLPVFPVGEKELKVADEHPLFPGEVLKPDGTHESSPSCNWLELSLEIRQFLRVAVECEEIETDSSEKIYDLYEKVMKNKSIKGLVFRYPRAQKQFTRLQKTNSLPSLKIPLDDTAMKVLRKQNPFNVESNVSY